jgi:hypothetical protein
MAHQPTRADPLSLTRTCVTRTHRSVIGRVFPNHPAHLCTPMRVVGPCHRDSRPARPDIATRPRPLAARSTPSARAQFLRRVGHSSTHPPACACAVTIVPYRRAVSCPNHSDKPGPDKFLLPPALPASASPCTTSAARAHN